MKVLQLINLNIYFCRGIEVITLEVFWLLKRCIRFSSKDPDAEFIKQAKIVLTKLKLCDILQRVMEQEDERRRTINEDLRSDDMSEFDQPGKNCSAGNSPDNDVDNEPRNCDIDGESRNGVINQQPISCQTQKQDIPISDENNFFTSKLLGLAKEDTGKFLQSTPLIGTNKFLADTPMIANCDEKSKLVCTPPGPSREGTPSAGFTMTPVQFLDQAESNQGVSRSNFSNLPNIFSSDEDMDDSLENEWPFTGGEQDAPTLMLRANVINVSSMPNPPSSTFKSSATTDIDSGASRSLRVSPLQESHPSSCSADFNRRSSMGANETEDEKRSVSRLKELINPRVNNSQDRLKRFQFKRLTSPTAPPENDAKRVRN